MDAHERLRSRYHFAVLLASLVVAVGCGGGGGGGGGGEPEPSDPVLTAIEPGVFPTSTRLRFVLRGTDLGTTGVSVIARFTANSGTPFNGGTQSTADVPGWIVSSTRIEFDPSPEVDAGYVPCSVTCLWPDGTTSTSAVAAVFRDPQKLTASDAMAQEWFGSAVSISGDTLLVGAADSSGFDYGAAYFFDRVGQEWVESQKVLGTPITESAKFGFSVAISGDRALIGAPFGVSDLGLAFLYERAGGTWIQTRAFSGQHLSFPEHNGYSVAIDGDVLAIGAPLRSSEGAVTARWWDGVDWRPGELKKPVPQNDDVFGWSVAVSDAFVVVGAPGEDNETGAAYVYRRDGGSWDFEIRLEDPDGAVGDRFGESVAISEGTVVVGSPWATRALGSGKVFVWRLGGGGWSLSDSTFETNFTGFGRTVAVERGRVAVSGFFDGSMGNVVLYEFDGSDLRLQGVLDPDDSAPTGNGFGREIGLSGDDVVTGFKDDGVVVGAWSGSAYGF